MNDHINLTHASLEAAAKPMTLDAIAKRLHGATPTKTQLKATERELKALHQAGLLESTPGRGGLPYYSLITPTVPSAPKPSAAAVAVFAALDSGPTPAPDLAEQLREAHAERLAMSQTIIAICCAIGRDPSQTTTSELPQALRDYIGAQVEREIASPLNVIAELRAQLDAQAAQHQAETGLLADKNAKLHAEIEHLRSRPTPMTSGATTPTPDAYLVTRHLRSGRGKTVADTDGPTRHKSIDTATRKARAAIRGGYVRAEIHATSLVAVATRGAEIKPARG